MTERMVCLDDFEKYAASTLPLNALDYYRSGANGQVTLEDNTAAFKRYSTGCTYCLMYLINEHMYVL